MNKSDNNNEFIRSVATSALWGLGAALYREYMSRDSTTGFQKVANIATKTVGTIIGGVIGDSIDHQPNQPTLYFKGADITLGGFSGKAIGLLLGDKLRLRKEKYLFLYKSHTDDGNPFHVYMEAKEDKWEVFQESLSGENVLLPSVCHLLAMGPGEPTSELVKEMREYAKKKGMVIKEMFK